jgi:LmbE family N-acetylglucosaminyl deacetylase
MGRQSTSTVQHDSRSSARHIFLSPHPDDVVWSCGGRIAELVSAAKSVVVITVFDGDSSLPKGLEWERWRGLARPSLRRLEDIRALENLGASRISFGLVDAALRHDGEKWNYRGPGSLNGPMAQQDECLVNIIRKKLAEFLTEADYLNLPIAEGAHLDHRIVRKAADGLSKHSVYYEEFPYSRSTSHLGLKSQLLKSDFDAWLSAAVMYRSQVQLLFGGPSPFKASLRLWAKLGNSRLASDCVERVWSVSNSE